MLPACVLLFRGCYYIVHSLLLFQSIGGFKGESQDALSGINQIEKLRLLKSEGVLFDEKGNLVDKGRWWDNFKID